MKMKPEHFAIILQKLTNVQDVIVNAIPAYKAANLSFARFMWDAFHITKLRVTTTFNTRDELDLPLYDYLNDSHIETALYASFRKLGIVVW